MGAGGPVRVIIYLDLPDAASPSQRRADIARKQDEVLRALTANDFTIRWRYATVPALAGDLHAGGLAKLSALPGVLSVDLDIPAQKHLAQSVPIINADDMHALGWRGQGVTVAILDTGVNAAHPDLSDDIIAQECFCTGGCCPNGSSRMSGAGSAADGDGHGSNVTGIVTANGVVSSIGVAPDAGIVAIKVLDNNGSGFLSDTVAALDFVDNFRPDVKVVNMSLGGGLFPGNCDDVSSTTRSFRDVINSLRTHGVTTFASSGNDASGTLMSLPACIANSISVGATYDASLGSLSWGVPLLCTDSTTVVDQVTCFSNSNSTTDLFAPGALIRSCGTGAGVVTYGGTSQASPHAAGCAADLLSAIPSLTPAQIETALETSPVHVIAPQNSLSFPRLDCRAALISLGACVDLDQDGYGQPASSECPHPQADCDDSHAAVYPGAPQICDGLNDNCSAPGWPTVPANEVDADADGSPQCADCNDGNSTVYPGAPQLCDGINNNCSAPGWPTVPANEHDGDGDGRLACNDCNDGNAVIYPGAPQVCDGLNNDCQHPLWPSLSSTNEFDDDNDSFSECQGDCNDNNFRVYPGAPQICDGSNNNCSAPGWPSLAGTNELDDDNDSFSECQGDCNDANNKVYAGAPQICDGLNNNCTATGWPSLAGTNDADDDGDSFSECQGDCNDAAGTIFPGATDLCDGLNNNCLAPGWPALAGTKDADDDGDGSSECAGDCNDADPSTYANAPESNDARDNQCTGQPGFGVVDEVSGIFGFNTSGSNSLLSWPPQAGASGYELQRSGTPFPSANPYVLSATMSGTTSYSDPSVPPAGTTLYYLVRALAPNLGSWGQKSNGQERAGIAQPETQCADTLDNDGDGHADCADPDCFVQAACAPAVYSFTDTAGDDVTGTSLKDFFNAHPAAASDFLLLSITGPGLTDYVLCAEHADFYRNSYLSLADAGGTASSGSWNRWTFQEGGSWSAPETASFENRFGANCVDDRSWCPEDLLANRSVALLPEQIDLCESLDFYDGCSTGSWVVTVKIGHTRLATCGF
ncbi:MAG TPA: MopE-related protein [Candidatus Polarisedimenticolia bacterium]|nr:MopE-related protein [Candidatus Polarisedimenticolia bacterium]